uniref:Vitellogenesis-inhibiting hormone n=1 Tax=Metapenaeus joyneri TaxID=290888 RepID=U3TJA2_9EUCA|nr:vitellogenesis-inhibiting hormone precursor [Metapenaeus joyneri]
MTCLRAMLIMALAAMSVALSTIEARSVDGPAPGDHTLAKRSLFDLSCTGVYNREVILRLNRLCDDCYNVYREPNVSTECRRNCFVNMAFIQCLEYLIPESNHGEYRSQVQLVGK